MNLNNAARSFLSTVVCLLVLSSPLLGQNGGQCTPETEEANKAAARKFYEQVWFTNNPAVVDEVFAPEYVAHDVGDVKGVREPASMQKEIAGFLWDNGNMSGSIDFQIADCDLVATRWQWRFQATSLMFKILGGREQVPIINVFRFENGKVVEVWNHRHDIDTPMGNVKFVKGLAIGLIPTFILLAITILLWRKLRRSRKATA